MKKLFTIIALLLLVPGLAFSSNPKMSVPHGGAGDLLMFPLYDLRSSDEVEGRSDGWQNEMIIENTSGLWTACHLRFRSWRTSAEVYDHVILLSPYDAFYLTMERIEDGRVQLHSDDTQTLLNSGLIYSGTTWTEYLSTVLLEQIGTTGDLNAELQAGHIEIIGLFQLMPHNGTSPPWELNDLADEDTHDINKIVDNVYNNYFCQFPDYPYNLS